MTIDKNRVAWLRYGLLVFRAGRGTGDGPDAWWDFSDRFESRIHHSELSELDFQAPFVEPRVNAMWRSFVKGADFVRATR